VTYKEPVIIDPAKPHPPLKEGIPASPPPKQIPLKRPPKQ
jgi:hypothetical protein